MTTPDAFQALESRLENVETKMAFNEDALDQLNEVVIQQQRLIDGLVSQLTDLKRRVPEGSNDAPFRSLRDELPPHY